MKNKFKGEMKKMFSKKSLWSMLALGSLFIAGCGDSEEQAAGESEAVEETNEADKWDEIVERGTIRAATSGTYYPNSYHDSETNELTGFEVEILREIADRLDLDIEFTEMGVDGMLTSLNNEQMDVAALSISHAGENADRYNYTIPYKYSWASIIVREEDNSGIESFEDFEGKRSAGAATTTYMKVAEHFGAELVVYDNATNDQYLWDVANGRTDFIVNDFWGQTMATEALPDIPVKIHEDIFFNPSETNFSMKLGNDTLTEQFNEQLEAMHEDGTLTEISLEFYGGNDVTQPHEEDLPVIEVDDEE